MPFTKLYLTTQAAGYTPATFRGAWDDTAGSVTRALDSAPGTDTLTTVARAEAVTTAEYDVLLYRGVSAPLAAQAISGTVNCVVGLQEAHVNANFHWHLHVYVTQGNTDTPRGTLLTNYREAAGVNEWPTSTLVLGTALTAAQTLSSLAVSAGDRIVVEIGYASRNTVSTSWAGTLRYGASRALGDLAVGVDSTQGNGFLTFSNAITEVAVDARVSQLAVETLSSGPVEARVSQFVVETLTPVSVPVWISQFVVETLTPTTVVLPAQDVTTGELTGTTTTTPPGIIADLGIVLAFLPSTLTLGPPTVAMTVVLVVVPPTVTLTPPSVVSGVLTVVVGGLPPTVALNPPSVMVVALDSKVCLVVFVVDSDALASRRR
jgi:hypothetical protein